MAWTKGVATMLSLRKFRFDSTVGKKVYTDSTSV